MIYTKVLRQPRGFLKFIEILLAILAFALVTAFVGYSEFVVECHGEKIPKNFSFSITCSYPYRLNVDGNTTYQLTCNESALADKWNTTSEEDDMPHETASEEDDMPRATASGLTLTGNYEVAAEFYVFVGVIAFLYTLAALAVYILLDHKYRELDVLPLLDLVTSVIFALLWLIASAVWADAVVHIKYNMDPQTYFNDSQLYPDCLLPNKCMVTDKGGYGALDGSIIFGFLSMCVWAVNIWYLFKESTWNQGRELPPGISGPRQFSSSAIDRFEQM